MGKILGIAIKNYGSLKDIKMGQLYLGQTGVPLGNMVAIIGPSGNGKSTLADAFGFIADALTTDVESACDASNRGGYDKLVSQGSNGPIHFEIYYKENALRNFQHVDDVFDGISVRLDMPAQIYAHRQRLLDNSRFTAPQRAAFTKLEECFDLFPIFKTAKEQLEQIEKKLMFYAVTSEQENKAIDALKFKEELCGPHGVLLLGKLLDPNGNELEATDSTIIKLAQEQSEASLSYQDEIPWGVCRLLQLFQGTNYQDI